MNSDQCKILLDTIWSVSLTMSLVGVGMLIGLVIGKKERQRQETNREIT